MTTLESFLSSHRWALLGILLAGLCCLLMAGCNATAPVLQQPATTTQPAVFAEMSADQLDQVQASKQAEFDKRFAAIKAEATGVADAPEALRPALAAATQKSAEELSADITAFNASMDAAYQTIANKRAVGQQVLQSLAGIATAAAKGGSDPLTWLNAAITTGGVLLGVGATADSRRKQKIIDRLATPAAGAA